MSLIRINNAAGQWEVSAQPQDGGAIIVRCNGEQLGMYEGPDAPADALAMVYDLGGSAQRIAAIKLSGLRAVKRCERSLIELAESGPKLSRAFPRLPGPRSNRAGERLPLSLGDIWQLHTGTNPTYSGTN